jgi:hypothetical protein
MKIASYNSLTRVGLDEQLVKMESADGYQALRTSDFGDSEARVLSHDEGYLRAGILGTYP